MGMAQYFFRSSNINPFSPHGKFGTSLNDFNVGAYLQSQYFMIEKGLVELVFPCIAKKSSERCSTFAMDPIMPMANLEKHINLLTRYSRKPIFGTESKGKEHQENYDRRGYK